jgi:hypothetical protein
MTISTLPSQKSSSAVSSGASPATYVGQACLDLHRLGTARARDLARLLQPFVAEIESLQQLPEGGQ